MDRTRNMPHQDLIPEGLNDPDWGRVMVRGPNELQAPQLGDPVRWGAEFRVAMPQVLGTQVARSGQIVSAQCRDAYSRSWGIAGSLSYPAIIFALASPAVLSGLNPNEWTAILSISMGVGQAQMIHNIDLRAVMAADRPFYRSSDQTMGGLIGPINLGTDNIIEPFVIPGSLVANALSIQVVIVFNFAAAAPDPLPFVCNVQLTPFAAGDRL